MNQKIKNRTSRPAISLFSGIEALESRTLLSAPYEFAAVGFRFDANSPAVFEMLGQLGADGTVSGTQRLSELMGSAQSGPLDWATFELLSGGRLLTTPRSGVDAYAQQNADGFVWDEGRPLGSLMGMFAGGTTDVAFLVQRAEGRTIDWQSSGFYDYQYLELDAQGFSIQSGQFYFAEPGLVSWSNSADGQNRFDIAISAQDEFGSLSLADGRALHVSPNSYVSLTFPDIIFPPGNTVLIVDADNTDGKIGIGIARRFNDSTVFSEPSPMVGTYRSTILTDGTLGEQFFGAQAINSGIGAARVAIELAATGDYRIYDLAAYDTGDRTVLASGTWTVVDDYTHDRRSLVSMTSGASGARAYFMINYDFAMTPYFVESSDASTFEPLVGSASPFNGLIRARGGHVGLNDEGHPIFYSISEINPYTEDSEHVWRSQDLLANWGGKPVVMVESVQLRQDNTIFMVVGVAEDGDVLVWDRDFTGRWRFRNITEELGASGIVSDLTIFDYRAPASDQGFTGSLPAVAVAGKNADGELVLYTPELHYDEYDNYLWTAVNVSEDMLTPFGESTPAWTGAIQGYQTTWGGMNVVGIDAAGDLVVAWTAPGLSQWHTTNVSDLADSPPVAGSISVIMTGWSGIHIHALDEQGALHVTWWVPQFVGEWAHNVLTDDAGGPLLDITRNTERTEAFTTLVGVGNTLNIVGFDANGRVRVYWWSPATNVWLVGDLTNSFDPALAPLGFAASDYVGGIDPQGAYNLNGQSLYGYNEDGTFSRVWWAPDGPDVWHVENLSEIALPVVN